MVVNLIKADIALNPFEPITEGVIFDRGLVPGADEFRLLAGIDPYGDTVFNYLQIDTFLSEWDRLPREGLTEREASWLVAIRALASRCLAEQGRVLLFFRGD